MAQDSNSESSNILATQYGAVLVGITFCYLLGAYKIEREHCSLIKSLNNFYSYTEWFLRVIILVIIGMASISFSGIFSSSPSSPIIYGLSFLLLCSFLFLLWDCVMALGGKVDFAWEFFKLDAFGAFAILACFVSYTYEWSNKDLFLGISAMIAGAYVFSSFVTFKEEFFFLLRNSLPKGNRR